MRTQLAFAVVVVIAIIGTTSLTGSDALEVEGSVASARTSASTSFGLRLLADKHKNKHAARARTRRTGTKDPSHPWTPEQLEEDRENVASKIITEPAWAGSIAYMYYVAQKTKTPFFLLHCRKQAQSSCASGRLCGSEYYANPSRSASQQLDITKGLGIYLFTRLVIGQEGVTAAYRSFSYSIANGHCFFIDPRVLMFHPFYAYKGDSGKTGGVPPNRDPRAVAKGTLSFEDYILENVCTVTNIFKKKAALNEIAIHGCVSMHFVKHIDTSMTSAEFKKQNFRCLKKGRTIGYRKSSTDRVANVPFNPDEFNMLIKEYEAEFNAKDDGVASGDICLEKHKNFEEADRKAAAAEAEKAKADNAPAADKTDKVDKAAKADPKTIGDQMPGGDAEGEDQVREPKLHPEDEEDAAEGEGEEEEEINPSAPPKSPTSAPPPSKAVATAKVAREKEMEKRAAEAQERAKAPTSKPRKLVFSTPAKPARDVTDTELKNQLYFFQEVYAKLDKSVYLTLGGSASLYCMDPAGFSKAVKNLPGDLDFVTSNPPADKKDAKTARGQVAAAVETAIAQTSSAADCAVAVSDDEPRHSAIVMVGSVEGQKTKCKAEWPFGYLLHVTYGKQTKKSCRCAQGPCDGIDLTPLDAVLADYTKSAISSKRPPSKKEMDRKKIAFIKSLQTQKGASDQCGKCNLFDKDAPKQ